MKKLVRLISVMQLVLLLACASFPAVADNIDPDTDYNYDSGFYHHRYLNDRVLKCQLQNGLILTIGVVSDSQGCLYFDPKCYVDGAEIQHRYGFYIEPETGVPQYSGNYDIGPVNASAAEGISFFWIPHRTLDLMFPLKHNLNQLPSGDVLWEYWHPRIEQDEIVDTIHIRVMDLDREILVGTANVEASYDTSVSAYRFTNLYCSDVKYTGAVSEDTREFLIRATKAFFTGGAPNFSVSPPEDHWDEMMKMAAVEKTPMPYFRQLYVINSNAIRDKAYENYDLIAVSIPYEGYVVFTAYYALGASNEYMLVAYDALYPSSKETFFENLNPEDVEFFSITNFPRDSQEKVPTEIYGIQFLDGI